jgi:predicted Zn-dependent protease
MTRHPRTPALIILVIAAAVGTVYVVAYAQIQKHRNKTGNQTLEALAKRITDEGKQPGGVSPDAWRAYADALMTAKQFDEAAKAYKEVIALQPGDRKVKFQCGLALAQAGQQPHAPPSAADDFYTFQKELVYGEAKLAVDLFDTPEAQPYLKDDRFASLAKEAKNQAMD